MSQPIISYLLSAEGLAAQLEEEFSGVLVMPEEGYYRPNDMRPFLPYRNSIGMPATYYVESGIGMDRQPVTNLSMARGLIYNENGEAVARIYKTGEIQLNPQRPIIGSKLLEEYLTAVIDTSRAWSDVVQHKNDNLTHMSLMTQLSETFRNDYNRGIPTDDPNVARVREVLERLENKMTRVQPHLAKEGNLYHRFINYLKPEFQEYFNRSLMTEIPEQCKEVSLAYLTLRERVPHQDHPLIPLINRVIRTGFEVIEPLLRTITDNPWLELSVELQANGDFIVRSLGDHRIIQWELDNAPKKAL